MIVRKALAVSWVYSLVFAFPLVLSGGQPPEIEWERTYGGHYGVGLCAQPAADGGYILVGATGSAGAGSSDAYLAKLDERGEEVWFRTFGGPDPDQGNWVIETNEGNYVIAGITESFGAGKDDAYLIKTDAEGQEIWSKTFGGERDEHAWSVQQTKDGGYILAGTTNVYGPGGYCSAYLVKADAQGNEEWSRKFGGREDEEEDDFGDFARETTDGGYILVGTKNLFGGPNCDIYLIKTDDQGTETWSQRLGKEEETEGYSVQETSDGGYIVSGIRYGSGPGGIQAYLAKTDAGGQMVWSKEFGGGEFEEAWSVLQTSDGGYAFAGSTGSFGAGWGDVYMVKTDPDGNEEWSLTSGTEGLEIGLSLEQTSDGGYIIAGYRTPPEGGESNAYLVKVSGALPPADRFRRGDSDSNGEVELNDAVLTLNHLFLGGPTPDCADAADADDNGRLNIGDGVFTLNWLFLGGRPLPAPGPDGCGADSTEDGLGCGSYSACPN